MWKVDVFKGIMLLSYKEVMRDTVGKGSSGTNVEGFGWTNEEYKLTPPGKSKSLKKDIKESEQSVLQTGKLGQESERPMRKQFIAQD